MIKKEDKRIQKRDNKLGCVEIENETARVGEREKKGRVKLYDSDQD
jgi:hypothetical protein